jgi:hypothetical protein
MASDKDAEQEEEDTGHLIKKILDDKITDGVRYFKVKWQGYSLHEATWEPEPNLGGSQEVLEEYLARKAGGELADRAVRDPSPDSEPSSSTERAPVQKPAETKPRKPKPKTEATEDIAPYASADDAAVERVVGAREVAGDLLLTVALSNGDIRTIERQALRNDKPQVWAAFLEALIGKE